MDNNMPVVSVCIVTYNQETFIEEAIKGVLLQKECDYELIIADDCSTDGTLTICQHYQKKHPELIRIIEQPQTKGVIENTKDCLMACIGKYIAICEGDDYWIDENKLKKQVDILNQFQDISMVHTSWNNFFQSTGKFQPRLLSDEDHICLHKPGKESVKEIMTGRYFGIRLSSVCFRNDILKKAISTDSELFSHKFTTFDIALFYLMAYHGRLYRIKDITLVYRVQQESVSITSDTEKAAKYLLGCLYVKDHFINLYKLDRCFAQKALMPTFHALFKYSYQAHDKNMLKKTKQLACSSGYHITLGQRIRSWFT